MQYHSCFSIYIVKIYTLDLTSSSAIFIKLESRAQANRVVFTIVVVAHTAIAEVRKPRVARLATVLRRRPIVDVKPIVWVSIWSYVECFSKH